MGDANFTAWERWERGIDEKAAAVGSKAAAPAFDPEGQLRARHAALWKATASMRAEMVQTEYLAQKINFGTGVKGTASRLTAGGYSAMYAVGGRTVSSVAEHAPMMVLSGVGTVFGSELAERTLVKQGQAVAQEGREMGDDVYTTKQLVSGEMQAAYEASRGPYKKYETAFHAFSEASSKFLKDQELSGVDGFTSRAKDIAAMDSAEKAMREASGEYQILCAKLGIDTSAKRLDTLASHIVQGSNELVGTAVTLGLPEVAPALGELKSALKGAEGMGVKKLEQEAAEAVAKSVVKEGEALAVGLEAEARTGMPVKNQKAIADAAKAHDVVIDVRGTNPEAPRRLAEGDLPQAGGDQGEEHQSARHLHRLPQGGRRAGRLHGAQAAGQGRGTTRALGAGPEALCGPGGGVQGPRPGDEEPVTPGRRARPVRRRRARQAGHRRRQRRDPRGRGRRQGEPSASPATTTSSRSRTPTARRCRRRSTTRS